MIQRTFPYTGPVAVLVVLSLGLAGCAGPPQKGRQAIAGKATIAEAMETLQQRRAALVPLRSGGQCRIKWFDDEGKRHEESCSIELRVCPPQRVFLRGSGLLGEMIRLGADENDFYLRIKPKEVSVYWGGRRSLLASCSQTLWINPDSLLEALGVVQIDLSWVLQHDVDTDVLTYLSPEGRVAKVISIDCRDYRPRRIDYHASNGARMATVEMDAYKTVEPGLEVPTQLRMTVYRPQGDTEVMLELGNVRRFEPTEAQRQRLFRRADTRGFKHIYELDENCRFVPQHAVDEE